jgi:ssDNA-binding Zn-finger/Zn-ribbon topoisomerase 1
MVRNRSIGHILGLQKNSRKLSSGRIRSVKVPCNCTTCNGKLVYKQTKIIHEAKGYGSYTEFTEDDNTELLMEEDEFTEDDDDTESLIEEDEFTEDNNDNTELLMEEDEFTEDDDDNNNELLSESEHTDHMSDSETFSEMFEDYSPPKFFNSYQEEETTTIDDRFSWILLWIMNFRIKFNISETATDALIKFVKLILDETGSDDFSAFPSSVYLAKKALGLKKDRFLSFVPCTKCNKLYKKDEVENYKQGETLAIMKCTHIEFPNSLLRSTRLCGTPLSNQRGTVLQPKKIYPFAGILQQLTSMFRRPGFEDSLRHWTNRSPSDGLLSDIYDGQIWQTLKDDDDSNFFRSDVADSHIGIMLNLDWFQPYETTTHSTGVIYAAICNLPREIRFKRENMLTLGILPGPREVKTHKINHYLAPVVDDLMSLWNGVTLPNTFECQTGKKIRAALILVSCDVPAARKICGHISALASCHRCKKHSNYENRRNNFAGIDEMDEWFISRDEDEHRQNALDWRRCISDAERDRFAKRTGVRWSELLRLPYFDPIRFAVVDPMHCLFLGIARWIVKQLWIDGGVLKSDNLEDIQEKMNEFKVPSDLGRIPGKVHCGEGFANFTADQWRNFFTIYATVTLWKHLSENDRKILNHFVRVCSILVSRIVKVDFIREAHNRLIEIVRLIEQCYGRDKVTPNLHLSLHLCECLYDYGPLYAFWCFSFERMNGVLGSLPNSHRTIEAELMRRLMNDNRIKDIASSGIVVKGLELLENRTTIGSLSENDKFTSDEMKRFWLNSINIQESKITGCEPFPGEMLSLKAKYEPQSESMLNLMVEFYAGTYEQYKFRKPADEITGENFYTIRVKINKFERCRIGSEVFGSAMSPRYINSSFILAKFITDNEEVDCYPGQIQYFFTHVIDLPDGAAEHNLAYVRWYRPADTVKTRYYFKIDEEICNVELWKTEFYPERRDCIIPVHNILGRFVPVNYKTSSRRNATEYLAVNPINRKFHAR